MILVLGQYRSSTKPNLAWRSWKMNKNKWIKQSNNKTRETREKRYLSLNNKLPISDLQVTTNSLAPVPERQTRSWSWSMRRVQADNLVTSSIVSADSTLMSALWSKSQLTWTETLAREWKQKETSSQYLHICSLRVYKVRQLENLALLRNATNTNVYQRSRSERVNQS